MRGDPTRQAELILGVTADSFVPQQHPIRQIKPLVDAALAELSPVFTSIYARIGRRSIPPEHLLKAQLLMALFSVPSARRFCDRLQYDMLFKWFLDLNVTERPFDASTFSKNQERLISQDVARRFLLEVVAQARRRHLLSDEHFSVDGTLLQAWASMKSVRPIDDDDQTPRGGKNPSVDFKGQRRINETHRSRTDPEARLARKGDGESARLAYAGHALMDNRHGLVVDTTLTQASGTAEWVAALAMLEAAPGDGRKTVGGDRAYDNRGFVAGCRERKITPHVAQWPATKHRTSAIDQRTTRHAGYRVSVRERKRIEEIFGWLKTVACTRKLRFIGVVRNKIWLEMACAAYDLLRMAKIEQQHAVA
jgi:transposase